METSRPRMRSGATSAMYIGERLEARPIATPPDIRQARNTANVPAIPVPIELTGNRNAESTRAEQTADQCAAHCQCNHGGRAETEKRFIERFCASDHDPVIPEQQPSHGSRDRDEPNVPEVVRSATGRGLWMRPVARLVPHGYRGTAIEKLSNEARFQPVPMPAIPLW